MISVIWTDFEFVDGVDPISPRDPHCCNASNAQVFCRYRDDCDIDTNRLLPRNDPAIVQPARRPPAVHPYFHSSA